MPRSTGAVWPRVTSGLFAVYKSGVQQHAYPPVDHHSYYELENSARADTGTYYCCWGRVSRGSRAAPETDMSTPRARSGQTLRARSTQKATGQNRRRQRRPARGVPRREAGRRAVTGPDRTATRQRHCSSVRHGRDTSRRHEREGAQFCQRSAHATPADAQMGRNCHEVHDELMKDGPHVKAFRLTQLWPKSMPVQGGNPIHLPLNF